MAEWSAAVLAAVGTLTTLIEAASLTFLFTFAIVCGLAFYQGAGARVITGFGVLAGATATVALDELLERYRMNLGKPDEWRGDPFHIISNIKTRTASIGGR